MSAQATNQDQLEAIAENRVLLVLAVNTFLKIYDADERRALVDEVLDSEELTTMALEDLIVLLGAIGVGLEEPTAEPLTGGYL